MANMVCQFRGPNVYDTFDDVFFFFFFFFFGTAKIVKFLYIGRDWERDDEI